jgi:hypothetical protein
MLAPPLADFLRSRRADCNARFAAARRHWPRLDAAEFSLFLRDQLSPLAAALDPAHVHVVLDRAYDLGLQLVAEKIAGPSAITPAINLLWTEVFPAMAAHIAAAPRRILGSLSNAAHHLAVTSDSHAEIWRSRLAALAPRCSTADELLIVAQLLAWRAGLAHFRASALAAADALPPELAIDALDAPSGANWSEVRDAYLSNPWFGCDTRATHDRRVGAFRGFGGLFVTPPLVMRSGSHILVRSGDESWILVADSFGATLHRASPDEIADAVPVSPASRDFGRLPAGHNSTSAVILGSTYAVTSGQSHSIWVGPATL